MDRGHGEKAARLFARVTQALRLDLVSLSK